MKIPAFAVCLNTCHNRPTHPVTLNPDDLNSFRPISNLPFLSKMIERVVLKQFIYHADQKGLLQVRQSAYRRFHSTESAVLVVHNDIVHAIDEGHVAALDSTSADH